MKKLLLMSAFTLLSLGAAAADAHDIFNHYPGYSSGRDRHHHYDWGYWNQNQSPNEIGNDVARKRDEDAAYNMEMYHRKQERAAVAKSDDRHFDHDHR